MNRIGGSTDDVDMARQLRKRFPEKSEAIRRLMRTDPGFRELCKDHDACVCALDHWYRSTGPEAKTRIGEYRALIDELEKEMAAVYLL